MGPGRNRDPQAAGYRIGSHPEAVEGPSRSPVTTLLQMSVVRRRA
ncbi:hypothetical protein I546_4653 [Mycobacterium kansasii 732]|nr:hypothetical protein I546_4653 [Mycobacterium kansasii 732]